MSTSQFVNIIKRKYKLLLISVLITGAASCLYSCTIAQPVFESTAVIMVEVPLDTDNSITYDKIIASQYMAKSYCEILKSNSVSEKVASSLNFAVSASQLKNSVSINYIEDTQIIQIKAEANTPEMARNIANGYAETITKYAYDVMKLKNLRIIDQASISGQPVWPKPLFNLAVGILAGCMCGIIFAVLPEYWKILMNEKHNIF